MATEAEPEFIPTTNIECEDKDQKGGEFDRTVYKSCQEELKKVDDRIEKLPGTGDNSANADTMKEAAVGALTVNTVFTGDVGNMQGESFLKSTSVAKVACEETCSLSEHDQTDKILNGAKEVSEYRNQQQKDLENEAGSWENKGMETTKEIAEKGNGSLDDVNTIGTGSQKTEIVEPAPKVGGEICEEERDIDQPVQTVDDQQTSVEENPETPKEALSGSEEDKKRETKMEEHTESESTEQFYNIIEATLSQNKEAFYYGPDSAEDSLDKEVETVTQVCDGEESIEKSFSAKTTLIGEELEETNPKEDEKKSEKPYSTAASEKGSEAIGASENEGDEKREVDQINCDGFTDDSILILKPNPGKQNNETIVEIGESAKETVDGPPLTLIKEKTPIEVGIEDKNNLDTPFVRKTEEMCSQKLENPVILEELFEIGSGDIKKSSQEEHQAEMLEKISQATANEEFKDDEISEKKECILSQIHEQAMTEASAGERRIEEEFIVQAEEKISSTESVEVEDHLKEEKSKHEEVPEQTFLRHDEPEEEKLESTDVTSEIKEPVASSESVETFTCVQDEISMKSLGESFDKKWKEEKPTDTVEIREHRVPKEKNLPLLDLNEVIEKAEVEIPKEDEVDLHVTHSIIEDTKQVDGEILDKQEISETIIVSTESSALEHTSTEGEGTQEAISITSNTEAGKLEKFYGLAYDIKTEVEDSKEKIEDEKQKNEETFDKETHEIATKCDDTEAGCSAEDTPVMVHSTTGAGEESSEQSLSEFSTDYSYEAEGNVKSNINYAEEVHDGPRIPDPQHITEEQIIKSNLSYLSPESIAETAKSFHDDGEEKERSKEKDSKDQIIEAGNFIDQLPDLVAENQDFQDDENEAGQSKGKINEESEIAQASKSSVHETNQDNEITEKDYDRAPLTKKEEGKHGMVAVPNLEEHLEKEKREAKKDTHDFNETDTSKEEDIELLTETSEHKETTETEDSNLNSKETETEDKKYRMGYRLESEEELEGKDSKEKFEEVYDDDKNAGKDEDSEKHIIQEESTVVVIPPQLIGEEASKSSKEDKHHEQVCKIIQTAVGVDEDNKKQAIEEDSLIADSFQVTTAGEDTREQLKEEIDNFKNQFPPSVEEGTLKESYKEDEVCKIFKIAVPSKDKEKRAIDEYATSDLSSLPVGEKVISESSKECGTKVEDSNIELKEQIEATDTTEEPKQDILKDREETSKNIDAFTKHALDAETLPKESNEILLEPSLFPYVSEKETNKDILEKEEPTMIDSETASAAVAATVLKCSKQTESEGDKQVEHPNLTTEEKGLATTETKGAMSGSGDINVNEKSANLGVSRDTEILSVINEAGEKVEYAMPDTESEDQTEEIEEHKLTTSNVNTTLDETLSHNKEFPFIAQSPEKMSLQKEDEPIHLKDDSELSSQNFGINHTNEEVEKHSHEEVSMPPESTTVRYIYGSEDVGILKEEGATEMPNQSDNSVSEILKDKDVSMVGDQETKSENEKPLNEGSECIEALGTFNDNEKDVETENPAEKLEANLKDFVDEEKATVELKAEIHSQESGASNTEEACTNEEEVCEIIQTAVGGDEDNKKQAIEKDSLIEDSLQVTTAGEDTREQIKEEVDNFKNQSPPSVQEGTLKESYKEDEVCKEFKIAVPSTDKENQTIDEYATRDLSSLTVGEKVISKSSKECDTKAIDLKEEVEDSNLELNEQIEATDNTEERKLEIIKDREETAKNIDAFTKDALDAETLPKESNEILLEPSLFPYVSEKETNKDILEKEEPTMIDSETASAAVTATVLKCSKQTESEGDKQVEDPNLTTEEKGLATTETKGTMSGSGDINVNEKPANLGASRDTEILSVINEAGEKVEYAMPDTESEDQTEEIEKHKLTTSNVNTTLDENLSQNKEIPFIVQSPEKMSLQKEDEPICLKDDSELSSQDFGINLTNEEVEKHSHEEVSMPPESSTVRYISGSEDVGILKEEGATEMPNQSDNSISKILKDKDVSIVGDQETKSENEKPLNEGSECIEALGTFNKSEKDVEHENPAEKLEANLKDFVEEEKATVELKAEICSEESGASNTKEVCTLEEEVCEIIQTAVGGDEDNKKQAIEEDSLIEDSLQVTTAGEDTREQIKEEVDNFKNQSPPSVQEGTLKESYKEDEVCKEFKIAVPSTDKENQTIDEYATRDLSSLPVGEKVISESSKESDTKAIDYKEEVEDSNLELKEQIEATDNTEKRKLEIIKDREETAKNIDAFTKDALDAETLPKESNEILLEPSMFPYVSEKETNKDILEKEEPTMIDSETASAAVTATVLKCSKQTESEGDKPVEDPNLTTEEKGLATTETKGTMSGSGDINVNEKPANLGVSRDTEILSVINEAGEKVEYAMPDTESEDQTEEIEKHKLTTSNVNTTLDENLSQNKEIPFIVQSPEKMSLQKEDEPICLKDDSELSSQDFGINLTNEEVEKHSHEEVSMPPESSTVRYISGSEDVGILKEEGATELSNQSDNSISEILKDKDVSIVGDQETKSENEKPLNEGSECIEALGTFNDNEKDVETENPAEKLEANLKEFVDEEKATVELKAEIHSQESGASNTEEACTNEEEVCEIIQTAVGGDEDNKKQAIEEDSLIEDSLQVTTAGEDTREQIKEEIDNFKNQSPPSVEEGTLKESYKEEEVCKEFMIAVPSTDKENQKIDEYATPDLSSLPVGEKVISESSKECDTKAIDLKEEVEDSNLELKEQIEATDTTEEPKLEILKDREETAKNIDAFAKDALEAETLPEESNEILLEPSLFPYVSEKENYKNILEKEEPTMIDSETASAGVATTVLKCSKQTESEGNRQVEDPNLTTEEKGLATNETKGAMSDSGDINVNEKPANLGVSRDTEILSMINEAGEKIEYAMPDTESEDQTEGIEEHKLMTSNVNMTLDETLSQNKEISIIAQTPQKMSLEKEDDPICLKDDSELSSEDFGINLTNEEVEKHSHEELSMPPESSTVRYISGSEDVGILKEEGATEMPNQSDNSSEILKDKDVSIVGDEEAKSENEKPLNEGSECIEALGTFNNSEKDVEQENPAEKLEANLKDFVEEEKTAVELKAEICSQESGPSNTKEACTLEEENLESADPGKELECAAESVPENPGNETLTEPGGTQFNENNTVQYQNTESIEQQITESEVSRKKEIDKEVEPILDDEDNISGTQSANETINDFILTEEVSEIPMVSEIVDEKENSTEQIIQVERDTTKPHSVSSGHETVHEVENCDPAQVRTIKLTDSVAQIETVILENEGHPVREEDESPLTKAFNESATERQCDEKPVDFSIRAFEVSEENAKEESIEQINNYSAKFDIASMPVVKENISGEPQSDNKPGEGFNGVTDDRSLQPIVKSETSLDGEGVDSMKLIETSDSTSKISTIECEDVNKEDVTGEKQLADEIEEIENASQAVLEIKDQCDKEINETGRSLAVEEPNAEGIEEKKHEHVIMNINEKGDDESINRDDSFGTKTTEVTCLQNEELTTLDLSKPIEDIQKIGQNNSLKEEGHTSTEDSKFKSQEDVSKLSNVDYPSSEENSQLTIPAELEASKAEAIMDLRGSNKIDDCSTTTRSFDEGTLLELSENSKKNSHLHCDEVLIVSEETHMKEANLEIPEIELISDKNQCEGNKGIKHEILNEEVSIIAKKVDEIESIPKQIIEEERGTMEHHTISPGDETVDEVENSDLASLENLQPRDSSLQLETVNSIEEPLIKEGDASPITKAPNEVVMEIQDNKKPVYILESEVSEENSEEGIIVLGDTCFDQLNTAFETVVTEEKSLEEPQPNDKPEKGFISDTKENTLQPIATTETCPEGEGVEDLKFEETSDSMSKFSTIECDDEDKGTVFVEKQVTDEIEDTKEASHAVFEDKDRCIKEIHETVRSLPMEEPNAEEFQEAIKQEHANSNIIENRVDENTIINDSFGIKIAEEICLQNEEPTELAASKLIDSIQKDSQNETLEEEGNTLTKDSKVKSQEDVSELNNFDSSPSEKNNELTKSIEHSSQEASKHEEFLDLEGLNKDDYCSTTKIEENTKIKEADKKSHQVSVSEESAKEIHQEDKLMVEESLGEKTKETLKATQYRTQIEEVAPDLVVDLDTATTNYNKGTTITKRDEETTTNLSVRLATGSSTEEAVHENVGENIEEASETHPRELVHEIEKEIVIAVADNQDSLMECEKQEHTSLESASESEVKEDLKLGQEVSPETETSPVKGSPHEEIPNDDRKIKEDEERPKLVFDKHIAVESITSAERTTINDEREHTESKDSLEESTRESDMKPDEEEVDTTICKSEDETVKPNELLDIRSSDITMLQRGSAADPSGENETTQTIQKLEKTSYYASEKQIPREVEPNERKETMVATGDKDDQLVVEDTFAKTLGKTKLEDLNPETTTTVESEQEQVKCDAEEITDDVGEEKISLSYLLQKSTGQVDEEKESTLAKEEMQTEKADTLHEEEAKSHEEKYEEEEGDEHKKDDSGSDAPVMVEASKDMDEKVSHKKHHGILSGVGSKVKHSISKVKKAITGKSSHSKPLSPK